METDHAKQQAEAQLASVHDMVQALQVGIDGPELAEDDADGRIDKARDAILEDALEVSVRSNWAPSSDQWEAESYKILLAFGGPSVRITGKLDEYNQPQTAQLEYQDWGTPWTRLPLTQEDIDALLAYAGCFYFGE